MALLPTSQAEFELVKDRSHTPFKKCENCGLPFTDDINHSPAGWLVALTAGTCEVCLTDILENIKEES